MDWTVFMVGTWLVTLIVWGWVVLNDRPKRGMTEGEVRNKLYPPKPRVVPDKEVHDVESCD